jgi:hypothetical protein
MPSVEQQARAQQLHGATLGLTVVDQTMASGSSRAGQQLVRHLVHGLVAAKAKPRTTDSASDAVSMCAVETSVGIGELGQRAEERRGQAVGRAVVRAAAVVGRAVRHGAPVAAECRCA